MGGMVIPLSSSRIGPNIPVTLRNPAPLSIVRLHYRKLVAEPPVFETFQSIPPHTQNRIGLEFHVTDGYQWRQAGRRLLEDSLTVLSPAGDVLQSCNNRFLQLQLSSALGHSRMNLYFTVRGPA